MSTNSSTENPKSLYSGTTHIAEKAMVVGEPEPGKNTMISFPKEATIPTDKAHGIKMLSNKLAAYEMSKDELEAKMKDVKKEIKAISDKLILAMRGSDVESFKSPSGATFYINTATRASIKDQDKAFSFLEEVGQDSLIKRTVNASSLSSAVKEWVENGTVLLTDLEEKGISIFIDESVRIRGLKTSLVG